MDIFGRRLDKKIMDRDARRALSSPPAARDVSDASLLRIGFEGSGSLPRSVSRAFQLFPKASPECFWTAKKVSLRAAAEQNLTGGEVSLQYTVYHSPNSLIARVSILFIPVPDGRS